MSKATEDALNALHGAVASTLASQMQAPLFNEGQKIEGTEGLGCSAAVLSVAVAFLKNNNVTASPATNTGLADLAKQLTQKREEKRNSLRAGALEQAAEDFQSRHGFGSVQ